jgi:hypothetical protein
MLSREQKTNSITIQIRRIRKSASKIRRLQHILQTPSDNPENGSSKTKEHPADNCKAIKVERNYRTSLSLLSALDI